MPLFRTCYDYVCRALFGARPAYVGTYWKPMGRAMIGDSKYDPLKDTFRKPMMAKLAESGITAQNRVLALHLVPYNAATAQAKLPGLPEYRGGFYIQYFNIEGRKTRHYRFRYLGKDLGFKGLTCKPLKYAQPAGTPVEVYFSPERDWQEIIKDDEPIYITEGELKAICACDLGKPTLGIGGVEMGVIKGQLHRDIKKFVNKGRKFYIVFDSDAATNINVRRAENRLVRALTEAGAAPHVVRLPSIMGVDEDGNEKKTGFDDFLLKEGAEAFDALIAGAKEDARSLALNELAGEVVYLRGPDIVYCPEDDLRMSPKSFETSRYSTRHFIIPAEGKAPARRVSTAKEFMTWEARPELNNFTFVPGAEPIVGKDYNAWPGWPYEPKKGDVRLWHRLLDHIFYGKPPADREWFEQWVAYPIQHPGAKLKQAVVIWGGQGTGKSFLGEIIGRLYGKTFTDFDNDKLNSQFNDWADSKQFALGEEIIVNASDRGAISEKLKQIVTGAFISIHRKYLNPYSIPNCMNMILVSNHPNALKIENDDRRYFIHRVKSGRLPPDIYKPLDKWSHSEEGLSALMYYLKYEVDTRKFEPQAEAMPTEDKADMVTASSTPVEEWLRGCVNPPHDNLAVGPVKLAYELWTAKELLACFKSIPENLLSKVTENHITVALGLLGIHKVYPLAVRTDHGLKYLWLIPRTEKSKERFMRLAKEPSKIGQVYNKEREDKKLKFTEGGSQKEEEKDNA